jgi:hypothetical protein
MARPDPNIYALQVELALSADNAFRTLDSFADKTTNLETTVSSAANKAIGMIQDTVTQAESGISLLSKAFNDVQTKVTDIAANMADSTKEFQTQHDTSQLRLKDLKEEFEYWDDINNIQTEMTKTLKEHLDHSDKFQRGLDAIIKAIDTKNKGHKAQNEYLRTDIDLLAEANKQVNVHVGMVNRVGRGWGRSGLHLNSIVNLLKQATSDLELFTATNYRAYGTQEQLLDSVRQTTLAQQVGYKAAVEAYAALGNLKVPRQELDRYAEIIAKTSRFTQANTKLVAEWSQKLRNSGMAAAGVERQAAYLGEAMRKFGLSTQDVNSILGTSQLQMERARLVFGEGARGIERWNNSKLIIAGFAKQVGLGAEELRSFEEAILKDATALTAFKAMAGATAKGVDGFNQAFVKAGIETYKVMADLEAQKAKGLISEAALLARREAMIETQWLGNEAMMEAGKALGKEAIKQNILGDNIAEVNKLFEMQAKMLNDYNNPANNTFIAQFNIMVDKLKVAKDAIISFVGEGLTPVLKWINVGIEKIGEFVKWFGEMREGIADTYPEFAKAAAAVWKWAKVAISVILVGTILWTTFVTVGTIFGGVAKLMLGGAKLIIGSMKLLVVAAKFVGQAFIVLLRSLGQGFGALGRAVAPVMVPLLALGAAIALVGAGAWMFAKAVTEVAQQGWAAVPAILGLTGTVVLLGFAFVMLGRMAIGASWGIAALAVGFVAVGVAAALTGVGLFLAGYGLERIAGVLTPGMLALMTGLAVVLGGLGVAAYFATPGFMAMSVAMIAAGVASILMGFGLHLIVGALDAIQPGRLVTVGAAFMALSFELAVAGALAIVAGVAFAAAGVAITAGAVAMGVAAVATALAGVLLLAAGFALTVGAGMMWVAAQILEPTAVSLVASGFQTAEGGALLLVGSTALLGAGVAMLAAGVALMAGGAAMWASTWLLGSAAETIATLGAQIERGGVGMQRGVEGVLNAGNMLTVAGKSIKEALAVFALIIPELTDVANKIDSAGAPLKQATTTLTAIAAGMEEAGARLYRAAFWIGASVDRLVASTANMAHAATASIDAVPHLARIGPELAKAATSLDAGVKEFAGPADRMTEVLDRLAESIGNFAKGIDLSAALGRMAADLTQYAGLLENAAERIEVAIQARAVPAMRAAERAGIKEAVRSEAISTVQVMDKTEGEGREQDIRLVTGVEQAVENLKSIKELLQVMDPGSGVGEILELLNERLPDMQAAGSQNLSSELSAWGI